MQYHLRLNSSFAKLLGSLSLHFHHEVRLCGEEDGEDPWILSFLLTDHHLYFAMNIQKACLQCNSYRLVNFGHLLMKERNRRLKTPSIVTPFLTPTKTQPLAPAHNLPQHVLPRKVPLLHTFTTHIMITSQPQSSIHDFFTSKWIFVSGWRMVVGSALLEQRVTWLGSGLDGR
jgi:hypothetical protein